MSLLVSRDGEWTLSVSDSVSGDALEDLRRRLDSPARHPQAKRRRRRSKPGKVERRAAPDFTRYMNPERARERHALGMPSGLDEAHARVRLNRDIAKTSQYSAAQLRDLGERGHALQVAPGVWDYPILTVADLRAAIRTPAPPSERVGQWVRKRAERLGREDLLPQFWTR